MTKFIIVSLVLSMMTSCVSYTPSVPAAPSPAPIVSTQPAVINDFPIYPNLIKYSETRPPIVGKIDNDYRVTDEFVNNSVLLKKYADRINAWKTEHKIK